MSSAAPLFSPEFLRDPYPTYRQHRAGPTFQLLPIRPNVFATFGYADCLAWFRDPRLTSARTPRFWVNTDCEDLGPFDDLIEHMQSWLLVQGPARHAVLRKLMNRGFAPAVIERLKRQIEQIVGELIGALDEHEPVDL